MDILEKQLAECEEARALDPKFVAEDNQLVIDLYQANVEIIRLNKVIDQIKDLVNTKYKGAQSAK